jgi:hypothetical protein
LKLVDADVLQHAECPPGAAVGRRQLVAREQCLDRRHNGVAIVRLWRDPEVHGTAA